MDKLLIVGTGGFGRVTLEHVSRQFDCSFIDDGMDVGEKIDDVIVVGSTKDLPFLFNEYKKIVIAIGNNDLTPKS